MAESTAMGQLAPIVSLAGDTARSGPLARGRKRQPGVLPNEANTAASERSRDQLRTRSHTLIRQHWPIGRNAAPIKNALTPSDAQAMEAAFQTKCQSIGDPPDAAPDRADAPKQQNGVTHAAAAECRQDRDSPALSLRAKQQEMTLSDQAADEFHIAG